MTYGDNQAAFNKARRDQRDAIETAEAERDRTFDRIAVWAMVMIGLAVMTSISVIAAVVYFVIAWANSLGGTP